MKKKRIKLGYSVLADYRSKPLAFKYRYLDKLSLGSGDLNLKLQFGTTVHKVLQELPTKGLGEAVRVALEGFEEPLEGKALSSEHLKTLMSQYVGYWKPENIIRGEFEKELSVSLFTFKTQTTEWEVVWRGTLDGISKDRKLLERKTTWRVSDLDSNRMFPNDQLLSYFWLLHKNDISINGGIVEAVCNDLRSLEPKRRVYDPEMVFKRIQTRTPSRDLLEDWERRAVKDVKRMIEDIEENDFSCNPPNACSQWNRQCAFFSLCDSENQAERKEKKEMMYIEAEEYAGFGIEELT